MRRRIVTAKKKKAKANSKEKVQKKKITGMGSRQKW